MSVFSEQEKIDILESIVNVPSVNDKEREVAEVIAKLLDEHGIDSEIIEIEDDRVNLLAEIGEGSPVLAISGHMDVVATGDEAEWEHPPFELTEDDGKLYGRGTTDMKSGVAALVIAFIEAHENDTIKNGTLRLMLTAGEESTQLGSQKFYDDGYVKDIDALLIGEPTGNLINPMNKGSLNIEVISKGEAAHSSTPFLGTNAIDPLLKLTEEVNEAFAELNDREFSTFDFSELVDLMDIEQDEKDELTKNLSRAFLTNTIFEGGSQINSVPELAKSSFNARTVEELRNDEIIELFEKIADKYNEDGADIKLNIPLNLEAIVTDGDNDLVKTAKEIGDKYFEEGVLVSPSTAITDASNLIKDVDKSFAFVIFGPGETDLPHKLNEYVRKDNYLEFIDIYGEIFENYLG